MSKRMRSMNTNINKKELYTISNAFSLLKSQSKVKFVESVDVAVNLGIDARKSDQSVRGSVLLPCGTGRKVRVAVFADVDNAELARDAGADLVGLDDLATQVENGKIEFDLAIASPESMSVVGRIGRILGPRGLMPNPKLGTVTRNIGEAVRNAKQGQIRYRNDSNGIVHATIGKVDFDVNRLEENLGTFLEALKRSKPPSSKGTYIKKVSVSTTMGIGMAVAI